MDNRSWREGVSGTRVGRYLLGRVVGKGISSEVSRKPHLILFRKQNQCLGRRHHQLTNHVCVSHLVSAVSLSRHEGLYVCAVSSFLSPESLLKVGHPVVPTSPV